MSIEKTMQALAQRDRALVAVAVLLDGREAGSYLTGDALCGDALQQAAQSLAQLPPEIRMPLAGTVLRESLEEMSR